MQHHRSAAEGAILSNSVHSSTFYPFKVLFFFFFLCMLFQKEGPRIATHLGTSSHVISHAFCLRSCAAHACWDNKLEASLWSWQHGFTKKSWGVSSFPPPPTSANDMHTYGAAASGSVTGAFICFHQADTVHEPQVCKNKIKNTPVWKDSVFLPWYSAMCTASSYAISCQQIMAPG